MGSPYIPAKDTDFDVWFANFATIITATPANYGLAAADATAITNSYNLWHTAYLLVANPGTKTSTTVADKDVKKAAGLIVARGYANIIQANAAVSNANKALAGLTVRSTGRTPVPTPGTAPVLGFLAAMPGVQNLQYHDTATPTSKAKPYGVIALEVYRAIGIAAAVDPLTATFYGLATKSPFVSSFDAGDNGKICTYFARYVTRTNKVGPWSAALSATVIGS